MGTLSTMAYIIHDPLRAHSLQLRILERQAYLCYVTYFSSKSILFEVNVSTLTKVRKEVKINTQR